MGSTAVFLGRARFIGKFSRAQRSFTHLFLDIGCHDPIIDCTFFYGLVGQVIEHKDIGSHVISDPLRAQTKRNEISKNVEFPERFFVLNTDWRCLEFDGMKQDQGSEPTTGM